MLSAPPVEDLRFVTKVVEDWEAKVAKLKEELSGANSEKQVASAAMERLQSECKALVAERERSEALRHGRLSGIQLY